MVARGDIHEVNICRRAPTITHLLCAMIVSVFKASLKEKENMKRILDVYRQASTGQISFQKYEIYISRNVAQGDIYFISNGVHECFGTGCYLRLPSIVGRSKQSLLKIIKDRIWKKINS